MSRFEFTVTVNDPDSAKAKVETAFAKYGLSVDTSGVFSGRGFEGRYSIVGHDVRVVITDKPFIFSEDVVVDKIRGFLNGV